MTNERDVERVFVRTGKAQGAMVLKLTSPGTSGVPDRLVLFADGTHAFVELKAPGKKPRPLQASIMARLEALGHRVCVIDSIDDAREFWSC